MPTFGKKLKELRENMNITQNKMAFYLDISSTTVSRYEKEEITPKEEIIVKAAIFFKVSTDYLLGLSSFPKGDDEINKVYESLNSKAAKLDAIIKILKQG